MSPFLSMTTFFLQMHGYGNPAFIIPRPITGISPKWKCKMVVELAWKLTFFVYDRGMTNIEIYHEEAHICWAIFVWYNKYYPQNYPQPNPFMIRNYQLMERICFFKTWSVTLYFVLKDTYSFQNITQAIISSIPPFHIVLYYVMLWLFSTIRKN